MARALAKFSIGLLLGVALTLIALDGWGAYLVRVQQTSGTPLLEAMVALGAAVGEHQSSDQLPAPWLPQALLPSDWGWTMRPLNGTSVRLGDLRGRVVFLNYWATYCGVCIAEMPGIERLANSLKGSPVTFALVDAGEPDSRVRYVAERIHVRLPVYVAGPPPRQLEAGGMPTTYILDRSGAIALRRVGAANWDTDSARAFIRRLAEQRAGPEPAR